MKLSIWNMVWLILAALVVAVGFWPVLPPAMETSAVVEKGQEEFARHLELGNVYTARAKYELAQAEYEAAALSTQPEIAGAAQRNLEKVLRAQRPLWPLKAKLQSFASWLLENVLYLVLLVAVLLILWWLLSLLPRRPGYLLLPFEDNTGEKKVAADFATLVRQVILQAREVHQRAQSQTLSEAEQLNIPLLRPQWDLPADTFSSLDTLSVGQINLPLGKTIQSLRQWINRREYEITGSVHLVGEKITAFALIRRSADGRVVQSWQLASGSTGQPSEKVFAVAEELAYRLLFHQGRDHLRASSWGSLQNLTLALQQVQGWQEGRAPGEALDGAAKMLNEAVRLDPGYNLAHFAMGVVCASQGDYSGAQDAFGKAIDWSRPDEPIQLAARYNRALAFYHEFRDWGYEAAFKYLDGLEDTLEKLQKTPSSGDEEAIPNLDLLRALTFCAKALVDAQILKPLQKDVRWPDLEVREKRIQHYCTAALDINDRHPDILAAVHYARGLIHLNHGDPSNPSDPHLGEAIAEFMQAVRARPNYTEGWIFLAIARYDRGEKKEAIRILEWIGKLKLPGNQYGMYRLGKILEAEGRMEEAEKAYETSFSVPEAHIALGDLYLAQGKRMSALTEYRAAGKLSSKLVEAWKNAAWCILHPDLLKEELLEEALSAATRMLQLTRGSNDEWEARHVFGWALYRQGKNDRAIAELKLSLAKKTKANCYHLGCVYLKIGSLEKAREMAIAALQAESGGPEWQQRAAELMRAIEQAEAGGGGEG